MSSTARLSPTELLVSVSKLSRNTRIVDGREAFIHEVASSAECVISNAIAAHGAAHVVLTGGTMGVAVLTGFQTGEGAHIDWTKVHFWWGDERFVPANSSERNAIQAREAFLNAAHVPEENIHEMPASDSGFALDKAADSYAQTLAGFAQPGSSMPRFDLTFLGIGPDSHVASLFPDHPDAVVSGNAIAVRNSPKPPTERVSLTYSALNTSERIWVVACGADKADAVAAMFANTDSLSVPSSCIHGRVETVLWADVAASSALSAE
jgi:6-phosphogluconolactonase